MTGITATSGFQTGEEFITFDQSPPTKSTPLPSASSSSGPSGKGKGRATNDHGTPATASLKRKNTMGEATTAKSIKRGRISDPGPSTLKEKKKAAERGCPWVHDVDWEGCHDASEMLNEEISAYYAHVSPTRVEYEVRLLMIELIIRAIHKTWPDAVVTPFGSWQTQLYLPTGDIDLVVATNKMTESNKGRLLAELARAMRLAHITDVVAIISKARVPIIKFVTTEGKLNVDISLNQTNGISAGKIINQYLEVIPGSRQLILAVKAFLSQRSMNEVYTGGLGSYAVICTVISFLQIHPKIRRSELEVERNLGTLLVEFFELYGRNFNYDEVGISIRRGGFYFSKRERGWVRAGQSYLLSIEDPQDRENDISGGSFGIRTVRAIFSGAYDMLSAKLFERSSQILAKKSGRTKGDWQPEDMSLLTTIMGITKETMKHRDELRKLHETGRLQRALGIPQKETDIHPYLTHYARTSDTTTSRRPQSDIEAPSPKRRKESQGRSGVGAIMVEDGEVDEFDSDSDFDDDADMDDGSEEGEIVETFANGRSAVQTKDRFASVSEDEDKDEEGVFNASKPGSSRESSGSGGGDSKGKKGHVEDEEDDSRYGLSRKPTSTYRPPKLSHTSMPDRDEDDSDSDDSIVAIATPAEARAKAKKSQTKPKLDPKDRQAFWAAKGQNQVIDFVDSESD